MTSPTQNPKRIAFDIAHRFDRQQMFMGNVSCPICRGPFVQRPFVHDASWVLLARAV